ncbi:MAG: efflux RND transporter periplasmic adaptor subunit [Candidatus Aenigmatarchaeota archaeon]
MIKILKNKFFLLLIIVSISVSGYFIYKKFVIKKNNNLFAIAQVKKGSIQRTISGSGNIFSVESFDVRSQASGKVIYLPFKEGDLVKRGELLVKIDSTDLEKQIRDLELSLESQKVGLEKLFHKKEQLQRGDDLRKLNESYLSIISEFTEKLPIFHDRLNNIYFSNDFPKVTYIKNNLEYYLSYYSKDYQLQADNIKKTFGSLEEKYLKLASKFNLIKSEPSEIDQNFIKDYYNLTLEYLNLIKFGLDKIRSIKENSIFNQQQHIFQDTINEHINNLNELYSTLLVYLNNFGDYINKSNTFYDNLNSLDLDIKNTQINIKQLEVKIKDLRDDLKDYAIYSPVTGYISQMNVKINDYVNPSQVLLTIQSLDKIAEVKLNEVDAAEIKIGNDVILTFDALPNFQLKGKIFSIDPIGEISQGVVSYKVKIAFENNPKVKIGMTVNADIAIEEKNNVLIVPNQAVKTLGNRKYVEVPDERDIAILNQRFSNLSNLTTPNKERNIEKIINVNLNYPPQKKFVETGLSDEKNVEILKGLEEGEWIIIKSPTGAQIISTNQNEGLFQKLFPQPRRFIRSPGIRQ